MKKSIATGAVIHDRNATVAEVAVALDGQPTVSATGASKREPGEVHDELVGELIAFGRALQNAGKTFVQLGVERYNLLNPGKEIRVIENEVGDLRTADDDSEPLIYVATEQPQSHDRRKAERRISTRGRTGGRRVGGRRKTDW